jgi:hypothetical protein
MKALAREVGFAVLAWLVPFAVSVCVFPLKQWHRPFFEEVMSLTLTATTTVLGLLYLRRVRSKIMTRAVRIGLTWIAANWALDLLMFSSAPMKMSFQQYAMDIAAAYFVIPVMTIGLGAAIKLGLSQPRLDCENG